MNGPVGAPSTFWTEVADAFALEPFRATAPVAGGLSNELWRVTGENTAFAVKVMRVNADSPQFDANVEAAFLVERAAFAAGVPCPEPVVAPGGGCLVRIGSLPVRVHRWVERDDADTAGRHLEAARLLAAIHAVSPMPEAELDDEPWDEAGWRSLADTADLPAWLATDLEQSASALADLEAATAAPGRRAAHALSHGDLDPKNTMVVSGALMALDWDAAGPQPCAREAVSLGLDWTTDPVEFGRALAAYAAAGGSPVPSEPWVFGGWVAAIGGWLVYNVRHRADTSLGLDESRTTLARLRQLHERLPEYLAAVP